MTQELLGESPGLHVLCHGMKGSFRQRFVDRVLAHRHKASASCSRALNEALQKDVKIDGFRNKNVHRAPSESLRGPILSRMTRSPVLFSSLLRIWMESHEELKGIVSGHLVESGVKTSGLDLEGCTFAGAWSVNRWMREKDSIAAANAHLCQDDISLMLCCVTGNFPDPELEVPGSAGPDPRDAFFGTWLDRLRELPADDPHWKEADEFAASFAAIKQAKEEERCLALRYASAIGELNSSYARELGFFQSDAASWTLEALPNQQSSTGTASARSAARLLELMEGLVTLLAEYKPLHEVPAVFAEEMALRPNRTHLQEKILACLKQLEQLYLDDPDPREAPLLPCESTEAGEKEDPDKGQNRAARAGRGECATEDGELRRNGSGGGSPAEPDDRSESGVGPAASIDEGSAGAAGAGAAAPADDPAPADAAALESENLLLRQEVESLRHDLECSAVATKTWRNAYEEVRRDLASSNRPAKKDGYLNVEDVNTAVALAKEKFTTELLFRLNSKSEIQDNPFQRPEKVWAALEWLATTFYLSKMGRVREPDFDESIRKACGWSYSGSQSDTTMRLFENWYTTLLEGKKLWLKRHIGIGSNKDPRYTIRIAFAWDKRREIVVVGYIGQHQQTRAT